MKSTARTINISVFVMMTTPITVSGNNGFIFLVDEDLRHLRKFFIKNETFVFSVKRIKIGSIIRTSPPRLRFEFENPFSRQN